MEEPLTLVNPATSDLAFKISPLNSGHGFDHISRLNCFTILWIQQGKGCFKADFTEYEFGAGTMLFFTPYQPFMLKPDTEIKGRALFFHPEFFCIENHKEEVACNGVLFNNIYQSPHITISEPDAREFEDLFSKMSREMENTEMAQYDFLVSYLKIFLISASRLKVSQSPKVARAMPDSPEPFVLKKLRDLIETNFRTKHAPAEYAEMLSITPKALSKISKTHFNKTLSDLIQERIVIEAKRELYLTIKPVREISYALGFEDEYYFSRFFKKISNISPKIYRETVGFNKLNIGTTA